MMRLFLKPTIASLQNEFEENDFADEEQLEEELLYRQGYEADVIDVEDGEEFEIPEGMCASLIDEVEDEDWEEDKEDAEDNEDYKLYVEVDDGVWEEEPIQEDLPAGRYLLDGHLIKVIEIYE